MEKHKKIGYQETAKQIDRVRSLYSRIGEPLAVDVIFDLYRHLGGALTLAREERPQKTKKKLNA